MATRQVIISGRIKDATTDNGIQDALIRAYDWYGQQWVESNARSDANGYHRIVLDLEVSADDKVYVYIEVTKPGYSASTKNAWTRTNRMRKYFSLIPV